MPPPTERIARKEYHYKDGYESSNGTVVRYQAEWTKSHQLEGDGLLPLLYDHMYKSDKTRDHRLRGVMIPDTVVFEHNFPRAWYNYDMKRGEILKQPGKQLDANSIYKEFAVVDQDCEIVAQFYYKDYVVPKSTLTSKKDERKKEKLRLQREQNSVMQSTDTVATTGSGGTETPRKKKLTTTEEEEVSTAVEFFTVETLHDFLHSRKVKPDGVLQKFVCPKGLPNSRQNFCVQCVWSPKVTRIYKRTNVYRLGDRLTSVERKAATFDGPPHFSTESLVAHSTNGKIQEVCEAIVKHFTATEHKPIERLVLYLKEDHKARLWVMWASSLRIGGDKLNPVKLRIPMQFALKVYTEKSKKPNSAVAGPDMNHRLLDSDIALFEMTGDWLFARSRCAGKGSHATNAQSLQGGSPRTTPRTPQSTPRTTPRRPTTGNSNLRNTVVRQHPQDDYDAEEEGALVAVPETPQRSPHREPAPPPKYLSPRAPFLAQSYKPAPPTGPESPSHPLHEKYMSMLHEDEQQALVKNQGHTGRKFTQRLDSSVTSSPQRKLKEVTAVERLKATMLHTTNDLLYQAYSVTLQQGASYRGQREVPKHQDETVLIPDLLKAALSPDQVQHLVKVVNLEEVPGSDGKRYEAQGALGRGRRQDRPLAMLLQDVTHFYDAEFTREGSTIYARWKAYRESLDVVDVEEEF